MLQLSGSLLQRPVLSLRTGGVVATTTSPIINPDNLKLEGFYCTDAFEKKTLVLLYQDIRDQIPQGLVVNDHDVLADPGELVRLKKTMDLHFELQGKLVVTTSHHKLGKVVDFATEVETMYIQKIYISQSVFKNFTGGNLGIDRSQIVEITDKKIIVHDLSQKVPARASAVA
jgi:sporulation protein YlmC with PRC-barrel domain